MEGATAAKQPLHALTLYRRTAANRAFAAVYACAILALLYHHAVTALHSSSLLSISLFVSDVILAFMWATVQAFRLRPVRRRVFPENLSKVVEEGDFPALDIFICTADPYKEPPMGVVNTALSVMAYDYPTEKLSIYVSDDGGSALTLFAFMEAAEFGRHWLPFCRKNKILERSPEVYFRTNHLQLQSSENQEIKKLYESMKERVENVVQKGKVGHEYITSQQAREAFEKWTEDFTRHDHPTVIQILLGMGRDKDNTGQSMPNLIYASREKSPTVSHMFKAGALNVLLRVSAIMTNSPIILTLDCDMYSNDPQTPHRALCYFFDSKTRPTLGYVQFPQLFHGLNKEDIYNCEFKRMYHINPEGMDGLVGPDYFGSGCFFSRRAFFGSPFLFVAPEVPELSPDHTVDKPIQDQSLLASAHQVANCKYENQTVWGSKLGFRYGSLVEDYYSGYRLQCEGWKSVFCHPNRPAFLGDIPITLSDVLNQTKRWDVGLLEVAFSKYSPLTFGTTQAMSSIMGLCYAYYAFSPILFIPITTYGFLPQLTLLNGISIFPKVLDAWFFLYVFLFLGAYGQDCLDFVLARGTLERWWSDQRMWMIRGVTCHLFGSIKYLSKRFGIATHGFNVTSKVVDDEQGKRYEQGTFEFGVESPMFVPLAAAAILNLAAFLRGLIIEICMGGDLDGLFVQMFIAGFVVLNSWPVYEAMALRTDKGRMPTKTTFLSTFVAWALYTASSLILKI